MPRATFPRNELYDPDLSEREDACSEIDDLSSSQLRMYLNESRERLREKMRAAFIFTNLADHSSIRDYPWHKLGNSIKRVYDTNRAQGIPGHSRFFTRDDDADDVEDYVEAHAGNTPLILRRLPSTLYTIDIIEDNERCPFTVIQKLMIDALHEWLIYRYLASGSSGHQRPVRFLTFQGYSTPPGFDQKVINEVVRQGRAALN